VELHNRLVEALKKPDAYDHPAEAVECIQTHISSVFLTGEKVYKLKKPVNFGFLDFSTLEQRERFCRAEVELNSRLAPSVYLGVAPVTRDGDRFAIDGPGEVVDWVVVMRQLDGQNLGLEVLGRGELSEAHIDHLVEVLVPFYGRAETGEHVDPFGAVDSVKFNTDENFSQTEAFVGKLLCRKRFEHIKTFTDRFLDDRQELFEKRIADGRIRDSHGDLHLGNVFFEDEPVIFDCIEFNDRFRCGDVAVDLAFMAMDLDFNGRPELARRFIDRYVAASGDRDIEQLMDFYCCYRAYVRGKISAFTSSDPALPAVEQRRFKNLARRYFGLAYRYAGGTERPPLVVFYGLMGTGKTSLARFLRERLGWHLLSTDAIRKHLVGIGENTRVYVPYNEGLYAPEMNKKTYAELCRRAENLLLAGFPVVIDGAFKTASNREPVVELASRAGANLLFVQSDCEPEEQHRRLEKRQQYDTRSDGRVEIMDDQRRDFVPISDGENASGAVIMTDGPVELTRTILLDELTTRGIVTLGDRRSTD